MNFTIYEDEEVEPFLKAIEGEERRGGAPPPPDDTPPLPTAPPEERREPEEPIPDVAMETQ